jgi:hypothetical protein
MEPEYPEWVAELGSTPGSVPAGWQPSDNGYI